MKNVSKLALFVAAGMVSAGVQAADFEVNDRTTVTLGGEVVLNYISTEDAAGDDTTEFVDDGSIVILGGSRDLGNGITGYIETEFAYDTLGESDGFERDATVFGFSGDFGEIQVGDSDNVFEDLITDSIDPFENASPAGASLTDEDKMVTFYSPDLGDFSFRLQTRVTDEGDGSDDGSVDTTRDSMEMSLIAAAQYSVGNLSLRAAYDDRGSVDADDGADFASEDGVFGIAAVLGLTDAVEVSARHAQESNKDGDDIDLTAAALTYDYGMGSFYGAVQGVSPDAGDSATQYGVGVNYDLADGLLIFAEYGDFDGYDGDDSLAVAGLIFEY